MQRKVCVLRCVLPMKLLNLGFFEVDLRTEIWAQQSLIPQNTAKVWEKQDKREKDQICVIDHITTISN